MPRQGGSQREWAEPYRYAFSQKIAALSPEISPTLGLVSGVFSDLRRCHPDELPGLSEIGYPERSLRADAQNEGGRAAPRARSVQRNDFARVSDGNSPNCLR